MLAQGHAACCVNVCSATACGCTNIELAVCVCVCPTACGWDFGVEETGVRLTNFVGVEWVLKVESVYWATESDELCRHLKDIFAYPWARSVLDP